MFSTGDEVVHKTGLFGSLFFQTERIAGGGLGTTMGVTEPLVLLLVALVVIVLLAWIQLVYVALRNYRAHLLEQGLTHR